MEIKILKIHKIKGPTLYLVFLVIVISAVFTFQFCPKLQDKHCREQYDYDRESQIQSPFLSSVLQLYEKSEIITMLQLLNCNTVQTVQRDCISWWSFGKTRILLNNQIIIPKPIYIFNENQMITVLDRRHNLYLRPQPNVRP